MERFSSNGGTLMADPFLKFYTSDWRSDPRLKMCSLASRGLWLEMLCLMHEATPYGHLLISGRSPTDAQLAVLVGAPPDQIPELLGELDSAGVFSRTKEGVIYSRKMTRMQKRAAQVRKSGQRGGNPKLTNGYAKPGYVYAIGRRADGAVKLGVSVNPRNRIKKIRAQFRGQDLAILGSIWTEDMGSLERSLHETLAAKSAGGEWFHLSDSDLKKLGFVADPKGSAKAAPLTQNPEARSQREKEDANASSKKDARGTRLPEDWVLPKEWGEWALAEGFDEATIRAEAAKFRDYWISRAGAQARKRDWQATWRNWMRNAGVPRRQFTTIDGVANGTPSSGAGGAYGSRWGGASDPDHPQLRAIAAAVRSRPARGGDRGGG